MDIKSFWTEGYAGQSPNGGHELAIYELLEIKPCGLGSRIRDMEAESYNWSHLLVNI